MMQLVALVTLIFVKRNLKIALSRTANVPYALRQRSKTQMEMESVLLVPSTPQVQPAAPASMRASASPATRDHPARRALPTRTSRRRVPERARRAHKTPRRQKAAPLWMLARASPARCRRRTEDVKCVLKTRMYQAVRAPHAQPTRFPVQAPHPKKIVYVQQHTNILWINHPRCFPSMITHLCGRPATGFH